MLKGLACIMVVAATTLMGFLFGEALKKRRDQLLELQRCLYHLQNEIIYTHTELPEAFYNVHTKADNPIGNIFLGIAKLLYQGEIANVYEAVKSSLEENKSDIYFNEDDLSLILSFSRNLGESDMEGEKKIFSITLENIKSNINSASVKMDKNLKMYRTLGFTAGTMIAILFV
ncbi:MAG: stage III sporulation protein SpoIIIAB [Solirubrobacterales bacterium]